MNNIRESRSIEEDTSHKVRHTAFTFLIGVLLVLIQVKVQWPCIPARRVSVHCLSFHLDHFHLWDWIRVNVTKTHPRKDILPYQVHYHRSRGHFLRVSSETCRPCGCLYHH